MFTPRIFSPPQWNPLGVRFAVGAARVVANTLSATIACLRNMSEPILLHLFNPLGAAKSYYAVKITAVANGAFEASNRCIALKMKTDWLLSDKVSDYALG